jgi:hypothetical protein
MLALVAKHHSLREILMGDTITGFMTQEAVIPLLSLPAAAAEGVGPTGKRI